MKRNNILLWLFSLSLTPMFAQASDNLMNNLVVQSALELQNTPYVAHTLDKNTTEQLVVNLREVDCLTFVENCLALSRTTQLSNSDTQEFARQLQLIRYRDGRIDGYVSRLHYTTDWITDNVAKGVVEDKTCTLGGKPYLPKVNFMSTHPESYAALKNHPQDVAKIRKIEQTINARTSYCYIPKAEIAKNQSKIESGDIICFVTNLPGLDISHVAIAYWNAKQLTFIHASTKQKKVIIQPGTLVDYCNSIKTNIGIMVLHPREILTHN